MLKGSWKTTLAGVSAALVAGGAVLEKVSKGEMPTMIELSALVTAFGLIFARDNAVTSEKAGAK